MSLKHAILGFLNYQPQTGYELKEVFDDSVQHFWSADQSQIYRTLNELMAENYVTMEVVPQDNRPNRKVYSITTSGRDRTPALAANAPAPANAAQRRFDSSLLCRTVEQ